MNALPEVPDIGDAEPRPQTFFGVPTVARCFVSRPRLLGRLDAAAERPVIVRGPGGAGKSSLVAEWVRRGRDELVVWLTLDEGEQSRYGFWSRVAAALIAAGAIRRSVRLDVALRSAATVGSVRAVVRDELSSAEHPVRLVLDDVHLTTDDVVADLVWLLEHGSGLRLVVATRRQVGFESLANAVRLDPVLIAGEELAFTEQETAELVSIARPELDAGLAHALHEATQGLPLAVRVAVSQFDALSSGSLVVDAPDRAVLLDRVTALGGPEFLAGFQGTSAFMSALRLSVVGSIDRALAAELGGPFETDVLLRRLADDGFGEYWLEAGEEIFSFHSLVRSSLERELERRMPAEVLSLRRIAARHLAAKGDAMGALRQYARCLDYSNMVVLVTSSFSDLVNLFPGEFEDLLASLPQAGLQQHGELMVYLAALRSLRMSASSEMVRGLAEPALAQLTARPVEGDPARRLRTLLAVLGALRVLGRYGAAAATSREILSAIDSVPPESRGALGDGVPVAVIQTVATFVLAGELEDAIAAARRLEADRHPWRRLHSASLMAFSHSLRGEMKHAVAQARSVEAADSPQAWRGTFPAVGWHLAVALAAMEDGGVETALESVRELDPLLPAFEHWAYLLWVRGRILLAADAKATGADELLELIDRNRRRAGSTRALDLLLSVQSDLYLSAGEPARARRILRTRASASPPLTLASARVHLYRGDAGRSKEMVAPLVEGPVHLAPRHHMEALLLLAVSDSRLGFADLAAEHAARALAVGERNGLTSPLASVSRAELLSVTGAQRERVAALLASRTDPFANMTAADGLTARELEVLRELAVTPAIRELAQRQLVSENTIKTQLRSAYRKLGVSSRTDAVAVARRRGLLSDTRADTAE